MKNRKVCFSHEIYSNLWHPVILRGLQTLSGCIIGTINLNNIRLSYDTALKANTEKKLQDLLDKVLKENDKIFSSINS